MLCVLSGTVSGPVLPSLCPPCALPALPCPDAQLPRQAVQSLTTALDVLPASAPVDLAAELSRLTVELLLSRGHAAQLSELAPQALSAAYRHWGELHPQTLAAARMLGGFAMKSGLSGVARDIMLVSRWTWWR